MKIGYARVSTDEQTMALQIDALKAAGCERIFTDEAVSGARDPHKRSGFVKAMAALEGGGTFVVWKLDRVGRSLSALIALLADFEARGIEFKSLTDGIDTTTTGGRLVYHIMGALAEFERSLISERTKAGMRSARRRGKAIGRPVKLTPERLEHAAALLALEHHTQRSVAGLLGVNETTLRRALRSRKAVPAS